MIIDVIGKKITDITSIMVDSIECFQDYKIWFKGGKEYMHCQHTREEIKQMILNSFQDCVEYMNAMKEVSKGKQ